MVEYVALVVDTPCECRLQPPSSQIIVRVHPQS